MIIHVGQNVFVPRDVVINGKEYKDMPYCDNAPKIFVDGVERNDVYMADDELGIAIIIMTVHGTKSMRMIGEDIGYPEIESPIFYKVEGKVEIKEIN